MPLRALSRAIRAAAAGLKTPAGGVAALIFATFLARLLFASALGLGIDESYMVAAGRKLQLSYFDHPPEVWRPSSSRHSSPGCYLPRLSGSGSTRATWLPPAASCSSAISTIRRRCGGPHLRDIPRPVAICLGSRARDRRELHGCRRPQAAAQLFRPSADRVVDGLGCRAFDRQREPGRRAAAVYCALRGHDISDVPSDFGLVRPGG